MSNNDNTCGRGEQDARYRDVRRRQRLEVRYTDKNSRSATRSADRRRGSDPARKTAWEICRRFSDDAYVNIELPRTLRNNDIHGRDAAFATELTYGTIRMRGLYDAVIEFAAGRRTSQIDPPILDTLRLGTHQILGMRVPPHAATFETVTLAREVNHIGASGLVNAVLRRITERTREEWITEVTDGRGRLDALAVEHSHPLWIVRALRGALFAGGVTDDDTLDAALVELLVADNAPPRVSLVARPSLSTVDELVDAGAEASTTSPIGALFAGGDPADIPAVQEKRAAVQDAGSQLLALAVVAAPVDGEHQEWLDLCAGPGGKAALLAILADQQGAVLFANEVSEHRTNLVCSTMAAVIDAGIKVTIGSGDGREFGAEEPDIYHRVLVDAPCTGLGTLRRRPEARWRRSPDDVATLTALQTDLLNSALDATRPGGIVGYATCSPHVAETIEVVHTVLNQHNNIVSEDARSLFRDAQGDQITHLGDGPTVHLWPHVHGTDAMFFALLRKQIR